MSKREDIIDGAAAIDVNRGLVYTCNLGWLDLGHMDPRELRPHVGATALWRQIQSGGPDATAPWCGWPHGRQTCGPGPGNVTRGVHMPVAARKDTTVRFADGATGFKVVSAQQMGARFGLGISIRGHLQREYVVRHGLGQLQKRAVALSIFMEVSLGFERMQGSFPFGMVTGDSSFSLEDLVSNLVGFYIAIGAVTKAHVLNAARPVSKTAALQIWDRDGSVGSRKNREFVPHLTADASYDSGRSCNDACIGQPRSFPAFLSSVRPAAKGQLFIDFPKP
jgi:hypothetical protein